jgi:hypothetical protein
LIANNVGEIVGVIKNDNISFKQIVTKTVSIKQNSASKWNLNVDYEVHYFETERNHIKLNIVIEEDK